MDYYSDEEYDFLLEEKEKKWNKIKHFTADDYLKCQETRQLLKENWDNKFDDELGIGMLNILNNHKDYLQSSSNNVLYRCENTHITDLIRLIKHHIYKEYDLSMFEEEPMLADPLLKSIDNIRREEKKKYLEQLQRNLNKNNKKVFSWGNIK